MIFIHTIKYLNYYLLSHHKKGHGIHSPFVFDLVSRVFNSKPDKDVLSAVRQVRNRMISDKRKIIFEDLGSGTWRKGLRKVSDIAKYSAITEKYGKLLSNIATEFASPMILELGTSLGISTLYMASFCPDTPVYTIEGSPTVAAIARQNFIEAGLKNVKVLVGPFDDILPGLFKDGVKPGLVFIDGNHRKTPVIKYFNQISEFSDSKTVVIIDDINYSKEMSEAWNEIKLNRRVSVSIDFLRMGILFFREGINQINLIIRY